VRVDLVDLLDLVDLVGRGGSRAVSGAAAGVAAVIVNWNTADLLDACLSSLRDHGGAAVVETVVVDNGSTDGSRGLLAARWPGVRLIANDVNVGFCRANNQAIAVTRAPYLLLVNADARLTPGCLDALVARLRADDGVGIVAPRLVYGDGGFQRWTAGRAPSLAAAAGHLLALDHLPGPAGRAWPATYLARDVRRPFAPDWVSSACMLVRRRLLDDVGLLDESIFVYMDDVELCQRARDAGWTTWYDPTVTAVHLMGQSTRRRTGAASPEALRAFNRYFRRRHGRARTAVLRGLQVAGFGGRAAAYGLAGAARPGPAGSPARARARAHLTHVKLSLETPEVPS
jgi:GT2 family glycosyltransferase